jgi:hypothetical protein
VSIVVDAQTISVVIASLSVVVGIAYYSFQIRHQTRIRKLELISKFSPALSMSGSEFLKHWDLFMSLQFTDLKDYEKKYGSITDRSSHNSRAFRTIGIHYESIGLLLQERLVDMKLVMLVEDTTVKLAWEKMKPLVEGLRERYNSPRFWEKFERIYDEAKKREQEFQPEAEFPVKISGSP